MQWQKNRRATVATATFFMTLPAWGFDPQPLPEPNSISLFGIGILGAILIARYIRKK